MTVHRERSNVEVTADEMELPVRGIRVVGVDLRRPSDVGKEHGAERRLAWIRHNRCRQAPTATPLSISADTSVNCTRGSAP